MTTLREAAQQALEALEYGQHTLKQISENQWESRGQLAITALKAALAEPDYWEEEARRYASNADYWRKRCVSCGGALPATGQDDRTGECVCGEPTALNTVHRTDGPCYVAEPVQEPVPSAWRYKDTARICDNSDKRMTAPPGWVPLYSAPPQRKPLTEEEAWGLVEQDSQMEEYGSVAMELIRAVERAHGIGEKE